MNGNSFNYDKEHLNNNISSYNFVVVVMFTAIGNLLIVVYLTELNQLTNKKSPRRHISSSQNNFSMITQSGFCFNDISSIELGEGRQ